MDVFSLTEARFREVLRTLPPQLDRVIDKAKREAAEDEAAEREAEEALYRRRKAGIAEDSATGESSADATDRSGADDQAHGWRFFKYGSFYGGPRKKAQIIGSGAEVARSITFQATAKLYHGGRDAFRKYPHETEKHDPNRMRYMMGQEFRTRALNTSLRNAREDKYQADVNQMKQLERMCILAMEKQADGSKFRLGRLPAKEYWDFSGTLLRRNHMATWKWTSNFFVLDNGLLYEFEDNMLTSKIVSVWPILGATFSRVQASAQQHPWVLEVRINRYYQEAGTEIIGRVELAAPTREERNEWLHALDRVSRWVGKRFRNTGRRVPPEDAEQFAGLERLWNGETKKQQALRSPSPGGRSPGRSSARRGFFSTARGGRSKSPRGAGKGKSRKGGGGGKSPRRRGILSFRGSKTPSARQQAAASARRGMLLPSGEPKLASAQELKMGRRRIVQHV